MDTTMRARRQPAALSAAARRSCIALAALASAISVTFAALTASNNAVDPAEKLLWAAFGIVAILGAHSLPALSRAAGPWVRAAAWAMWATCMAYATYSHASYFMLAQQHAGMRRAALSSLPGEYEPAARPNRPLSAVLEDEVKVRGALTKVMSVACQECSWIRGRISELTAKIKALEAEAREVQRAQSIRDQTDRMREERRADPVTSKLASWVGTKQGPIALIPAVVFALILDGLASLCWLLATQRLDPPKDQESQVTSAAITPITPVTPVTPVMPVTPVTPVTPAVSPQASLLPHPNTSRPARPPRSKQAHDFEALVAAAIDAVGTGKIKPTVTAIRNHLGCGQAKASLVRKALLAASSND